VQTNAAGQVVLKLKTAWRDGTTHLVMSPLEFMQRRIEWRLLGGQICDRYGSNGSTAGLRELNLDAADLSVEKACHTADDQARHGRPGGAPPDRPVWSIEI
jgi:hypothetical protein